MAAPYNVYKITRSQLGSVYSHRLLSYTMTSRVFINNKTVSIASKLCWSTTPASRLTRGAGPIRSSSFCFCFCFFSQASTIMTEVITMIQARTGWIFSGVLHSQHSLFSDRNDSAANRLDILWGIALAA